MKLKSISRSVKQISLGISKKLWGRKNAVAHCCINLFMVLSQTPWSHRPSSNLVHSLFPKPMIDFTQPCETVTPPEDPCIAQAFGPKESEQQDLSLENIRVHVAVIDTGWLCRWYIASKLPWTPGHWTQSQASVTQGSSSNLLPKTLSGFFISLFSIHVSHP